MKLSSVAVKEMTWLNHQVKREKDSVKCLKYVEDVFDDCRSFAKHRIISFIIIALSH